MLIEGGAVDICSLAEFADGDMIDIRLPQHLCHRILQHSLCHPNPAVFSFLHDGVFFLFRFINIFESSVELRSISE